MGFTVFQEKEIEVQRLVFQGTVLMMAAALWSAAVCAQAPKYPVKPVRMIVPLPPAGTTDIMARLVAQKLTESLGQTFIVDNRPGGGTTIGSAVVAKSVPDGYTLLFASGSLATSVPLYPSLPYDPVRDLAPVGLVGQSFFVLAVHPSVPVRNFKEFVALARSKPKRLSYASAGAGTITHFTVELFQANMKIDMLHVPYKGGAPAIIALVGGQVEAIFNPIAEILPHIRAGNKVRALAVTNPNRAPDIPDVPTLAESGCPACTVTTRLSMFAPAGTPGPIIERLNAELNRLLQQADVRERFQSQGLVPLGSTPAELGDYLKAEIVRWTKVVKDAGIKIE
jgi:tripartite-type tricarboxylate transporter receptor subunit TctC